MRQQICQTRMLLPLLLKWPGQKIWCIAFVSMNRLRDFNYKKCRRTTISLNCQIKKALTHACTKRKDKWFERLNERWWWWWETSWTSEFPNRFRLANNRKIFIPHSSRSSTYAYAISIKSYHFDWLTRCRTPYLLNDPRNFLRGSLCVYLFICLFFYNLKCLFLFSFSISIGAAYCCPQRNAIVCSWKA